MAGLARLVAAGCAGDNCNRAITGTAFGATVLSSRLADCTSFFRVTVTPSTTYVHITFIIVSSLLMQLHSTTTIAVYTHTAPPKRGKLARSPNTPITQSPTAIPSYASAACDFKPSTPVSVRYSSACSCAGATIATTTVPSPVSHWVYEPNDKHINIQQIATATINLASCVNFGLQWAAYPFDSGSTYDPTIYKSQTPEASGDTTTYTYNTDNQYYASVYGSDPIEVDLIALNHRGFFIAEQSGTYTFTVDSVDDWLTLWIGPDALSGWTLDNALFTVQFPGGVGNQYTMDLDVGIYPIRFMWVNGGSIGVFGFTITAPDGTTVESPDSGSQFLVTDCALASTPAYPAFGSET